MCVLQLQGTFLEVMLGKEVLNCRYDHKKALAMWLHQKPCGQISHLIKDRNGQRHNADPGIDLEQALSEHSRSPSPPKKKQKRLSSKPRIKKQIPARFTRGDSADTANRTAGAGNSRSGDDCGTLESLTKSLKTTLEKTAKVQEDLLRENGSQLASLSKTVTSLVDKVDKMSKKVSVVESALKDLAKGLGKSYVLPKDHATRSSGLCPTEDQSEINNPAPSRSKPKKVETNSPLANPTSSATTEFSDSAPTRKASKKKGKQMPASPPTPPPVPPSDSVSAPSGKASKKKKEKPKRAKPQTPPPPSPSDSASESSESRPSTPPSSVDSPPASPQSDQGGESKRERPMKHQSPQRDGFRLQHNGAYRPMAYDPMMFLHQLASHNAMQQHPNFNYGYTSGPPSDSQNQFHGAHWSSAKQAGHGVPQPPVEYARAPHDSGHSSKRHNTQQIKEKRHDKKHKPR